MPRLGITDIWTYVLGTIFIVLLPGPNSMYVLSVAAQRGVRAGYAGHAACSSATILMVLSAAGVASLLKASPGLFTSSSTSARPTWLDRLQMLRGAAQLVGASRSRTKAVASLDRASNPFSKALVISLLNPKAILFFISFFIQFVDPHSRIPALSFVALGLVCQICSFPT
jgi:leucine efflux protein